ncbi:sulfotransferase family protein [Sediminitomix flava]|uniref:Sulfotransferase domain-containing protein n=1 Tax=Sediminitomix flava TaxID=379075 RepID=A0A316A0W6_SEDFL|nr:sulfotransferase [Sediminitomix flava]PWJ43297.1 sulfotransferase domain-containing protein [Sediminitomix flava]
MSNQPKLDFILIGAMKSGTTSLADNLAVHPQINFSEPKEPHFFCNSDWRKRLKEYEKCFKLNDQNLLRGEGTTSYAKYPMHPHIVEDLYEYNPNLKIIYLMREPVSRAISHYIHCVLRKFEHEKEINKALLNNSEYVNTGRYYMQIEPYLNVFGRHQVLLLPFEEYIQNSIGTYEKIANFLEIEKDPFLKQKVTHSNRGIGLYRDDQRVDKLLTNSSLTKLKDLFPQSLRTFVAKSLYQLTRSKVSEVPKVNDRVKEYIYRASRGDLNKIEDLLGYRVDSWHKYSSKSVENLNI